MARHNAKRINFNIYDINVTSAVENNCGYNIRMLDYQKRLFFIVNG